MNVWPQILIALLCIGIVIGGFVRHGKPVSPTPINGMHILWMTFALVAVLGAGGFWSVR